MTPKPEKGPSSTLQAAVGIRVASSILFDLLPPELGVSLGPSGMFWTTVPETPVNKDGEFQSRKRHIGHTTRSLNHAIIDSITQPTAVKFTPQGKLSIRARLTDFGHAPTRILSPVVGDRHLTGRDGASFRTHREQVATDAARDRATEVYGNCITN